MKLKLQNTEDLAKFLAMFTSCPPTPYRKGYTYSTRPGDLSKRIEICQHYLIAFINHTSDKKRKDNAMKLLAIFDWYVHVRSGKKYGEIIINPFCLLEEMDKGISIFWYQTLVSLLNKYSMNEKQLHTLIKATIRRDKLAVSKLITG